MVFMQKCLLQLFITLPCSNVADRFGVGEGIGVVLCCVPSTPPPQPAPEIKIWHAMYFSNHFSFRGWITKKRGRKFLNLMFSSCFFSHVGQSMIKHLILFVYYALVSSWILSLAPVIAVGLGSGMICLSLNFWKFLWKYTSFI